ncbi:hypothetical protein B296_00015914 [Ensete ventricosum]|uniref:SUEL-type lectin domain-containing protein n=1 Tax=Ensete ventricosum TaxID=4639 RepID=A0A426YQW5_ENSVE|nr:hypothetical protein B296_00015914 [Ensete ventricosum]
MQDSGAYLEHRLSGVHTVVVQGLNAGSLDLSQNVWGHKVLHVLLLGPYSTSRNGSKLICVGIPIPKVALEGERQAIYDEKKVDTVKWEDAKSDSPITWYKVKDGMVFCLTTITYHVPRSYLKSKDNLMVVFEEHRGQPEDIQIVTVKRDNICSFVSEFHPPQVRSWAIKNSQIETVVNDAKPEATLSCTGEKVIRSIVFASFGNPSGMCGNFTVGSCHARQAKSVVEQVTLSPPPLIRLIITSDACMLCCNGRPAWGRPAACCR